MRSVPFLADLDRRVATTTTELDRESLGAHRDRRVNEGKEYLTLVSFTIVTLLRVSLYLTVRRAGDRPCRN